MNKTKILFIVPDLYSGGAQRVFLNLLKQFDRTRFDISLIILIKPKKEHFAAYLPTDIKILQFDFKRTIQAFYPLISQIRKENPDIVFSTLTHLNFILGVVKFFVNKKILFVVRESSIISSSMKDEKFSFLFRFLYRWVYRNLDLIICQSAKMADDLIENFKLKKSLIRIIYNPIDFGLIFKSIEKKERSVLRSRKIQFLCVGRLYSVKGYDRLLKLLSLVTDIDFHLTIVGDGPLKDSLVNLTASLNLKSKVTFVGIQENPFQFMAESDCLLLSSYYEGLPNVVLEANACGLPVIAFNSPGGTGEIIIDGLNGWLIEDDNLNAFADKITSKEYLQVDKQQIVGFVTERFSLNKITLQYEEAILSLRGKGK